MEKIIEEAYNSLVDLDDYIIALQYDGCIDRHGKPLKCQYCGSTDLESKTIDSIDHVPCELEVTCSNCKEKVGYWAYGNWSI